MAQDSDQSPRAVVSVRKVAGKRYLPLDVGSWGEGWKVVTGWILVPIFAMVTTGLLYSYEMKVINVTDRDVRDMYMDQRLLNAASNTAHKLFINADICCNSDPIVFNEPSTGCKPWFTDHPYFAEGWGRVQPLCPPLVTIECPNSLTSTACNLTRQTLYPLLGMDPVTGKYTDCSIAGQVLVGAQVVAEGRPLVLVATWNDAVVGQLPIGNPLNIDVAALTQLLLDLIQKYVHQDYVSPNVRLGKAFAIDGVRIPLSGPDISFGDRWPTGGFGNAKTIKPWPFPIFNWPGVFAGSRCKNTSGMDQWWLDGHVVLDVPDYNYNNPQAMVSQLTFLTDSMMFSPWKLKLVDNNETVVGKLTDTVSLQLLTEIKVYVGLVKEGGACHAWLLDDSEWGTKFTYREVYQGSFTQLLQAPFPGNNATSVYVRVMDVSAPQRPALPFYGGMWFIVFCFGMGAVWAFSLGFFIVFGLPLIWWNVRINRNLPPIVYRYMKKYRGW